MKKARSTDIPSSCARSCSIIVYPFITVLPSNIIEKGLAINSQALILVENSGIEPLTS